MAIPNRQVICLIFLVVLQCCSGLPRARNHVSSLHRPIFDSTRVELSSLPPNYYTEQVIDHFSPNTIGTFQQKYYVNDTFWGGVGSPIFLILGGEGPISASDVTSHFIISEYAQQFSMFPIKSYTFY